MDNESKHFKTPNGAGFQLRFIENPHMEKGVGVVMVHPDDYAMIRDSMDDGPSGKLEVTKGMAAELDDLQRKWAMLNPEIRQVIDNRMREMIKEGRITKTPQGDEG